MHLPKQVGKKLNLFLFYAIKHIGKLYTKTNCTWSAYKNCSFKFDNVCAFAKYFNTSENLVVYSYLL